MSPHHWADYSIRTLHSPTSTFFCLFPVKLSSHLNQTQPQPTLLVVPPLPLPCPSHLLHHHHHLLYLQTHHHHNQNHRIQNPTQISSSTPSPPQSSPNPNFISPSTSTPNRGTEKTEREKKKNPLLLSWSHAFHRSIITPTTTMINSNGVMSSSSSNPNTNSTTNTTQSPGLKTYFKTPDGRYKLHYEKTHPAGFLHYSHGKAVTQATLAHLKEKTTQAPSTGTSSSSLSASSGVRLAAARLLGGSNGSRALSFVGGNGTSKTVVGTNRIGSLGASSTSNSLSTSNYDGKGTYLIFNVGDTVFISDFNSQDKDPVKSIHFGNSNPVCHAFDPDAKDGHDLLIGLYSGDVYSVSLRQQLQDFGKKLVGAQHYNKDGSVNNCRCTSIAWVPEGDGTFVVAHADGNMYIYEKNKDGTGDSSFPVIKDQTQFSVAHTRSSKSNPIARWHICQGSINSLAFSTDGTYLATVGRDGYLRVFDYSKEQLICGGKSYYGASLCCAWSMDGKYILTGGEDDLVQVWSMDDRKVVAWGEGHSSWVSGVAFDSFWSSPSSDGNGESVMYRFGSVGQDTQLLLWDLVMDELVVPLRRPPGGSPTFSTGSQSAHWDNVCPVGTLQSAPSMRDVPKLSPLVVHRVHSEPLSGLIFTQESVVTVCREGHVKIWMRPGCGESQSSISETMLNASSKEKPLLSGKVGSSSYKQ